MTEEKTTPLGVKNWVHSPDTDNVLVRRFMRSSSLPLARLLAKTPITPNMVTIFGFLLTIPAFILLIQNNYIYSIIGAVLGVLSFYLDYVDGSLARIKNMGSIYGQFLDMYFGRFGVLLLYLGIIIGAYRANPSLLIVITGFLAYTAALMNGAMYNSFHRLLLDKAKEVIATEKKHQKFIPNFYYVEVFYYPVILIAAIIGRLDLFLYFGAMYGWLFTFGTFYIFGKAIKKEAKRKKEEDLPEE